jgi:6-phosphogluconolactonase
VLPVSPDGRLKDASSVLNDDGALGPNKDRQNAPHAHWIEASARNRFAYVSDLGLDRVFIYKFDAASGSLTRGEPATGSPSAGKDSFSATLAPGTGPRHIAFSLNGNFMYVLGELDSTVTVFANEAKQTYRSIQKISAIPASFTGLNEPAEIVLHPSGKFLYTSNRGDDSIAVFAVNGKSGKLRLVQRVSSGGKAPRHFAIDPLAKHLLAANEDSGNIVEFTIDPGTGKLTTTGEIAKVASAVCLIFVPIE